MGFKHFAIGLSWRVALLALTALGTGWLAFGRVASVPMLVLGLGLLAAQAVGLYRYAVATNRKLTRFLESVRYSDFAISFRADQALGASFDEVNQQFNEVLEAFRQARAEKEASLHYLNTLVQHVSVGLIAYDAAGTVELVNQAALRLLGIYRLRTVGELAGPHPELLRLLRAPEGGTPPGGLPADAPQVYGIAREGVTLPGGASDGERSLELALRTTSIRLRGRLVTLVSLQNIRNELQQKESEAWQNLTKVLRHEIMNSLTPVVSLVGTMRQIVDDDLRQGVGTEAALDDLAEALQTIEARGRGLMRFVEAYRHFTALPAPRLQAVALADWLARVVQLSRTELRQQGIALELAPVPPDLTLRADADQLDLVLINLLRNAAESIAGVPTPRIQLEAQDLASRGVRIRVVDNGPGIAPEALERVFIPFYTTKKTGSGIGLSLSRQIIHRHGGTIAIHSPGVGCVVEVTLPKG
jgi:nitrogen fixation/metabolism regulation signal transduction histidine kinase